MHHCIYGKASRAMFLLVNLLLISSLLHAEDVSVVRFKVGDKYKVVHKSDLTATATEPAIGAAPAQKILTEGTARISYRERVLSSDARGRVNKVLRLYDTINDRRKVNGQEQETSIRPEVHRIIIQNGEKRNRIFCPDGPLTWTELQYYELHETAPMLEGFLPDGPIRLQQNWKADQATVREFANLPQFLGGEVLCQFDDYVDFKGLKLGRIVFQGTLTGANFQELAAGGSAKVQVNGALYFDDKTKRIHSMRTMAERDIFDRANNLVGSMKDDFQLAIQFLEDDADLTDAIIGPLQAEPTEAKLMLLYEQPGLGIRIMHPRRWELASVVGNQLLFEFNEGSKNSSVVFNVEREGKTPTTREFFEEVTASLNAKKTEFRQRGKVEEVESSAGRLGNFRLQCTLDNLPRILDYWTLEIKKRGITVSSRLSVDDVKIAADDIETMVRGIHFLPPLTQVKLSDRTEIPQPTRKAIPAAKNP